MHVSILLIVIILWLRSAQSTSNQWILVNNPPLPRPESSDMAISYYNRSIFLLGGAQTSNIRQLVEYDIDSNVMIDHNQTLTVGFNDGSCSGQFFTQIDDVLLLVNKVESTTTQISFSAFDFKTKSFEDHWRDLYIPFNSPYSKYTSCPCITSLHDYLFILGGTYSSSASRNVQVLDLRSNTWLSGFPPLQQTRKGLTCQAHPMTNELYALGGYSYDFGEKILLQNITLWTFIYESWSIIKDITTGEDLIIEYTSPRSIVYEEYIVMWGGDLDHKSTDVLNVITGEYSTGAFMKLGPKYAPGVIVDERMYLFGGALDFFYTPQDTWQYYDLPFSFLTEAPTESPILTEAPTANPVTFVQTDQLPTSVFAQTDKSSSDIDIDLHGSGCMYTDHVSLHILLILLNVLIFLY